MSPRPDPALNPRSKADVTRRGLLGGLAASGGLLLTGCSRDYLPPAYGSLLGVGEAMTFASHRLLLKGQPLVREFDRSQITQNFPSWGTTDPEDAAYQRQKRDGFADWRLPVTGLVQRPLQLSLNDLKGLTARSQITLHACEQGWSAIAEWTGVPLARVLELAGLRREARYIFFRCIDGWWDSLDLFDALHPQTLLTYGMNGGPLPVKHGAPLRLRVERQLGYKSLKFVTGIEVMDRVDHIGNGTGIMVMDYGYSWYAGI
jgi:DMSO/TMAO reductase YedYZ molybdopterin-dependent catalytic subunit